MENQKSYYNSIILFLIISFFISLIPYNCFSNDLNKNNSLSNFSDELKRVKSNYDEIVLKGKKDPYQMLMKNKNFKSIVGPEGSNLFALVKIKSTGKGSYYRTNANKILYNNKQLQKKIKNRFLNKNETITFFKDKNPVITDSKGNAIKLEWHHSSNHIGTVALIRTDLHRLLGNKRLLHVDGSKGGNDMYNVLKNANKDVVKQLDKIYKRIKLNKKQQSKLKSQINELKINKKKVKANIVKAKSKVNRQKNKNAKKIGIIKSAN